MSVFLKASIFSQGRRCFSQLSDASFILNKLKLDYSKSQVTCSYLIKRCIATQRGEHERFEPTLVYQGNLARPVRGLKLLSLTTTAIGLIAWPVILNSGTVQIGDSMAATTTVAAICLYSLSTPFIMHYFSKRYIQKLEYDAYDDKYIATIFNFFCRDQKLEFKLEDVVRPEKNKLFTTVMIKGMPMFFDESTFIEPEHCIRLMGYDQPIDFKLNEVADDNDDHENEHESETKERMKRRN